MPSTRTRASARPWRYGVTLFPVSVLASTLSDAGSVPFVRGVDGDAPLASLVAFGQTVLGSWIAPLAA